MKKLSNRKIKRSLKVNPPIREERRKRVSEGMEFLKKTVHDPVAYSKRDPHKPMKKPNLSVKKTEKVNVLKPFTQGIDPKRLSKIAVASKLPCKCPSTSIKYGNNSAVSSKALMQTWNKKTKVNEHEVFNGRVEFRIGTKKFVFESITPAQAKRVAVSYASVNQPVTVNVIPSGRDLYTNKDVARYMTEAIHYREAGMEKRGKESLNKAARTIKSIMEKEYSFRTHGDKKVFYKKTIPTVVRQTYQAFRGLYESCTQPFEVTVITEDRKGREAFEVIAKGVDADHAAYLACENVIDTAGPDAKIVSARIGNDRFNPKKLSYAYASPPKVITEDFSFDTARLKKITNFPDANMIHKQGATLEPKPPKRETYKFSSARAKNSETRKIKNSKKASSYVKTKPDERAREDKINPVGVPIREGSVPDRFVNHLEKWLGQHGKRGLNESRKTRRLLTEKSLSGKSLQEQAKVINEHIKRVGHPLNLKTSETSVMSRYITKVKLLTV